MATLMRAITARDFLIPVVVLSIGSAAIGALTGMLPALATSLGIPLLAATAAITVLAVTSALAQPWVGRWNDTGRIRTRTASIAGTASVAFAFLLVGTLPGAVTILLAALLTGIGVAILTPVAFGHLAATSPPDRLGRTMGTAELGRETGDAIGPLVVGGVGMISLPLGLAAFGLLAAAGILAAFRLPDRNEASASSA